MKKVLSGAVAMALSFAVALPMASACPSQDCPCSDKATRQEEDQSKTAKTAKKDKAQPVQKEKKAPAEVSKK